MFQHSHLPILQYFPEHFYWKIFLTEYLNCPNSLHKGQWLGIGDHNETRLQTLGTKYSVPGRRFVFIILYSYENSLLCCYLFLIYSGCGCGDLEKYHLFITLQQTSQTHT